MKLILHTILFFTGILAVPLSADIAAFHAGDRPSGEALRPWTLGENRQLLERVFSKLEAVFGSEELPSAHLVGRSADYPSTVRCGVSPAQEGPSISIPRGERITLDGVLNDEEWAGASRYALSGGGELLFLREGEEIAVGVRGNQDGFPHLALSAGDSAWVLHASASLGMIVYERGPEKWSLVRGPVWELRDPTLSERALRAREAYLDQNGWVGTTAEMGQEGEAEFLIRIGRYEGENVRLAVAFLPVPITGETMGWPENNSDEIGMTRLLTGPMPEELRLDPTGWGRLDLFNRGEPPTSPELHGLSLEGAGR